MLCKWLGSNNCLKLGLNLFFWNRQLTVIDIRVVFFTPIQINTFLLYLSLNSVFYCIQFSIDIWEWIIYDIKTDHIYWREEYRLWNMVYQDHCNILISTRSNNSCILLNFLKCISIDFITDSEGSFTWKLVANEKYFSEFHFQYIKISRIKTLSEIRYDISNQI